MDSRLLLVTIATLLFKESQLQDPTVHSANLAKEVIATLKLGEPGVDFDRSREMLQSLRLTVARMAEHPAGEEMDRNTILQRIRVNAADEEGLYYAFEQGIEFDGNYDNLKKQCMQLRGQLRDHINQHNIKLIMKDFSHRVNFKPDDVEWRSLLREVNERLEPYSGKGQDEDSDKVDGMLEIVDLSDADHMTELFQRQKEETSSDGVLKTGYQAVNRMLGRNGGFRRGEMCVIGALQFNYKTGFTLNLARHLAIYNTPHMRDATKKPLILHMSAENELASNVTQLYVDIWENKYHTECDQSQIDPVAAQAFVEAEMSVNGYTFKMGRFDPSSTTYESIFDMVRMWEARGYEIHAIVFDYLNMISKAGCLADGPIGANIRDLYRRVRNFMAPKGITFITPHQISTEGKKLTRMGTQSFVKEIANKGYYDGCGTLDQEVDLELYIHKEVVNGESFLTIQRGKHRGPSSNTPLRFLYTVLPFFQIGAIRDDIRGPDLSRKVPGGGPIGSDDEIPWFSPSGGLPG